MLIRPILNPLISPVRRGLLRAQEVSEFRALLADLFGDGSNGLIFVPQPLLEGEQTLYQIDNGTTLTDANGDPVGLGLEWSKGLELGAEQAPNPGPVFTETTGFSGTNGTVSVTDGNIRFLESDGISRLHTSVTLEVGKSYRIIISARSSSAQARFFSWSGFEQSVDGAAGSIGSEFSDFSHVVRASSENVIVRAYIDTSPSDNNDTLDIQSLSIKELPGNHLTQSVSTDRPTYNTDGSLHWLEFDGAGDNLVTNSFSTTKTIMLAFRRLDINDLVILSVSDSNENIFTIQDGSSNPPHGQANVAETLLDGVTVSTRDELHDATSDLVWHVVEARMADLSAWADIKIGDYATASFNNPFELGIMAVFDADDADTRRRAREYIADQYGITL